MRTNVHIWQKIAKIEAPVKPFAIAIKNECLTSRAQTLYVNNKIQPTPNILKIQ
jgi:hypothetical protein